MSFPPSITFILSLEFEYVVHSFSLYFRKYLIDTERFQVLLYVISVVEVQSYFMVVLYDTGGYYHFPLSVETLFVTEYIINFGEIYVSHYEVILYLFEQIVL